MRQNFHCFSGRGYRPCHSAAPGSGPALGPKPPASARPAPGGRWPAVTRVETPFLLRFRARGGNAMRFQIARELAKALPPLQWQGPMPLPQCRAGIRTGRGPKPPASARPAHGGRFSPAGSGAGLCVSRTCRSKGHRSARAGKRAAFPVPARTGEGTFTAAMAGAIAPATALRWHRDRPGAQSPRPAPAPPSGAIPFPGLERTFRHACRTALFQHPAGACAAMLSGYRHPHAQRAPGPVADVAAAHDRAMAARVPDDERMRRKSAVDQDRPTAGAVLMDRAHPAGPRRAARATRRRSGFGALHRRSGLRWRCGSLTGGCGCSGADSGWCTAVMAGFVFRLPGCHDRHRRHMPHLFPVLSRQTQCPATPTERKRQRPALTFPSPHPVARQRTFSVASPISARISEMIQNRITICGSAQPFFSKW